ncbi:MAG: hypothetical protein II210_02930, partial [Rikenellaceae bacterium]|nr:hypothetical protein [Rikenellaceae bacterium]
LRLPQLLSESVTARAKAAVNICFIVICMCDICRTNAVFVADLNRVNSLDECVMKGAKELFAPHLR